jgi:CysZ protein
MKYLIQFKDGFLAPLRGAKFLFTHKGIIGLAVLPAVINFFLYAFLSYLAYHNFANILGRLTVQPHLWYQYILYYLTGVILAALIVTVMIFSFTMIGNLIASPFNDLITRKVFFILGGKEPAEGTGLKYIFKDISRLTSVEIKKIVFSSSITGIAILGGVIVPVLSVLVWFIAMAFLGFQFIDYSLEVHKISFGKRLSFMLGKVFMVLGLGFSCSIFIAIPVIGFLFLPFAVTGAAQLYYKYGNS